MLAGSIQRLIKRGQALLPVEHEIRGFRIFGEFGRPLNCAGLEKQLMTVLDSQQRPRREVADYRFDEFVSGIRIPNEVALKIG
jgi:hypothetical protein